MLEFRILHSRHPRNTTDDLITIDITKRMGKLPISVELLPYHAEDRKDQKFALATITYKQHKEMTKIRTI